MVYYTDKSHSTSAKKICDVCLVPAKYINDIMISSCDIFDVGFLLVNTIKCNRASAMLIKVASSIKCFDARLEFCGLSHSLVFCNLY